MAEDLPSLQPPIAFAHRGGAAHAPENTLEAFSLARRLGADGLESDVWVTADGVPVLHHDPRVRLGRRGRRIGDVTSAQLPEAVPTLAELYERCGRDFHLSLDVKDPAALEPVLGAAREAGADLDRLWLCAQTPEEALAWRPVTDGARLVCTTRRRAMRDGAERLAARLADGGVDAVNLHHTEWSGGLTTLFHRFERLAFAWDAQHTRMIVAVRRMGIDAVYSDHVDRLVDGLSGADGP